jgi:succinoglycan biosynthesis protein ExoO
MRSRLGYSKRPAVTRGTTRIITVAPQISVIIPVFNSSETLPKAVQSVLNQTLQSFEIIIVNDGSNDNTLSISYALAKHEERIKVIDIPENLGKAHAMNTAMSECSGEWIAVLDADDIYIPDRLETLLREGGSRNVDLVADNQIHIDPATGTFVRYAFDPMLPSRHIGVAEFAANSSPNAPFSFGILKPIVKSSFIDKFDLKYYEGARFSQDFYYLIDFFASGGRAWLISKPLYQWTLPFSPSTRAWTTTGNGPWRYNFRSALATNKFFENKYKHTEARAIKNILSQKTQEYRTMISYIDAQKMLEEKRRPLSALLIIILHPSTWYLLMRRIFGRVRRRGNRYLKDRKSSNLG